MMQWINLLVRATDLWYLINILCCQKNWAYPHTASGGCILTLLEGVLWMAGWKRLVLHGQTLFHAGHYGLQYECLLSKCPAQLTDLKFTSVTGCQ